MVADAADWARTVSVLSGSLIVSPPPDAVDWSETISFVAAASPNADFPDWTDAVVTSGATGGGSGSGPTFLSASVLNNWGSTTTGTINAPPNIQTGALLVMCAVQGFAGTTFTSSGFTQLATLNPGGGFDSFWVGGKIATAGEPATYTLNMSQSGSGWGTVVQYSGATTNDGAPTGAIDFGTGALTVPSLAPTGTGRVVLVLASANGAPITITGPAGFGVRVRNTAGPSPVFAVFDLSQVLPVTTGAMGLTYAPFGGFQCGAMAVLIR